MTRFSKVLRVVRRVFRMPLAAQPDEHVLFLRAVRRQTRHAKIRRRFLCDQARLDINISAAARRTALLGDYAAAVREVMQLVQQNQLVNATMRVTTICH